MFKKIVATLVLSLFVSTVFSKEIPTRFGSLDINEENVLLFNNQPLNPEVRGNNSLSLINTYQFDNKDVVLVQDTGGTACPALFHFINVSASGVKATSEFGSCTDLISVKKVKNAVVVKMGGYRPMSFSKAEFRKASKEKFIYIFKDGVLTENGKRLK